MREVEHRCSLDDPPRLTALSSLYTHLVRHGHAARNPVGEVERPAIKSRSASRPSTPAPRSLPSARRSGSGRCLVPLDSFYEWKKTAAGKQPYAIALKDRRLMRMAGYGKLGARRRARGSAASPSSPPSRTNCAPSFTTGACQRWPPLGNIFGTSIEEVRFA
jgi:SOS response associated peptidase (SRAP)